MSNISAIVSMEAADKVDPTAPLEDRFRAAMEAVQNHWMATNESDQFDGAVEAVYRSATDDERERIRAELQSIKTLNAMLSGVPIDFDAVEPAENPIGLIGIWHSVRA